MYVMRAAGPQNRTKFAGNGVPEGKCQKQRRECARSQYGEMGVRKGRPQAGITNACSAACRRVVRQHNAGGSGNVGQVYNWRETIRGRVNARTHRLVLPGVV